MRRLVLVVGLLLPLASSAAAAAQARDPSAERARLLALINAYRAEHHAPPLALSATLQRAAEGHSADMAARDYFAHETPEGRTPFDRTTAAGYRGRSVGENLAAGNADADATFQQWRRSPAHDQAMRDPRYRAAGLAYVGRAGSTYRHYWTMLFGDRLDVPLAVPTVAVPRPVAPAAADADDDDAWGDQDDEDDDDDDEDDAGDDDDADGGEGCDDVDADADDEGERRGSQVPPFAPVAQPSRPVSLRLPTTLDLAALQAWLAQIGLTFVAPPR